MRYRQWKKNYKKRIGVNPPISIDKRKQRKKFVKVIRSVDVREMIGEITVGIKSALAEAMRTIGNGLEEMGTTLRSAADNMQQLKIEGCALSWEVKPVVCDWGVYENCEWNGSSELKLITNSYRSAVKIVEIMKQDQLQDYKLNYPERVKREGA